MLFFYILLSALVVLGGCLFGIQWIPVFFLLIIASIDNGGVLAERALTLEDTRVPWPRIPLRSVLEKWFPNQRRALPWLGLWLSLPMKVCFAFIATSFIGVPWILSCAGIYLLDLSFEAFFSKSFLKLPIVWVFRQILSRIIVFQEKKYPSFWMTVITLDIFLEAAFSLDEALLAASRLINPWAAAYAMVLSTLAMRAANGPFQALIKFRPVLGKAIYGSILLLGVELVLNSRGIDIYSQFEALKPISSLFLLALVVVAAEVVRWIKVILVHLRDDHTKS